MLVFRKSTLKVCFKLRHVLEHVYAVLEQGVLLNGTCFYLENQVFGGVSNQEIVTSKEMFLLATVQYIVLLHRL
jgi:hypothetical protein